MLAVEVRISIHCEDFHSLYSSLLFDRWLYLLWWLRPSRDKQ